MAEYRTLAQRSPSDRVPERELLVAKSESSGAEALPRRWSAARKAEIAIRLHEGDVLGTRSRETQQPASSICEGAIAYPTLAMPP